MIKAQGDREQAMSEAEWKQLSNLIENDRQERVSSPITCINCDCHTGFRVYLNPYRHPC